MKWLLYSVGLLTSFFAAWTGAFILTWVSRGDTIPFEYYFNYLLAVITLSGGEIVPFMFLLTCILFIPLTLTTVWLIRYSLRRGGE
jgi:hypothetical protein